MSEANRKRREQNREARVVAAEEHLRRSRQQRVVVVSVGLLLAVAVGLALVARAATDGDDSASSGTTTTTGLRSVAGKPCVARTDALPPGAPDVAVKVGPPPTKLVKVDLQKGTGPVVKPDATVTVDYIGVACSTGKIFDSSYQQNQSLTTPLSDVPAWRQGVPGMRVGGQRLLGVPAALAYGSEPPDPSLAPDESLWFVVKVVKIEPDATTTTTAPAAP